MLGGISDFWACHFGTISPDLGHFMPHPPWAKRALIFIRRECPAAFEKLVETGETVQGMFLSSSEEAGKVAGHAVTLFVQCFPDPECFMPHHPWATRAQIVIRCEHPAASQRLAETGVTDYIILDEHQGAGWHGCCVAILFFLGSHFWRNPRSGVFFWFTHPGP